MQFLNLNYFIFKFLWLQNSPNRLLWDKQRFLIATDNTYLRIIRCSSVLNSNSNSIIANSRPLNTPLTKLFLVDADVRNFLRFLSHVRVARSGWLCWCWAVAPVYFVEYNCLNFIIKNIILCAVINMFSGCFEVSVGHFVYVNVFVASHMTDIW